MGSAYRGSGLQRQGESMPRLNSRYEGMSSRHSQLSNHARLNPKLNASQEQIKPLNSGKQHESSLMKLTGSSILGASAKNLNAVRGSNRTIDYKILPEDHGVKKDTNPYGTLSV